MRIGIVTTWFERGAAYVSRQYRDVLRHTGHEVFIYARSGERYAKGDPTWDTPEVTWGLHSPLPWITSMVREDFDSWLLREGIELVIFNEQQWFPPVLWAREANVPAVAYVDYYTEDSMPLFALYDALICNTKRHATAFDWHPHCLYIPWGTNTRLFQPSMEGCTGKDAPVFFHSAGVDPLRKGTDLVLEAFANIQGMSRLVIHSQWPLHKTLPSALPRIQELSLAGRLMLHEGEVSAPGLYHLGDVYVYPSRLEGIGLTQVEALACGLPLIVPDWPPMNEFVTPDSGRTVPVDRIWARTDGYYWPQCRVSVDNLTAAMQFYVDNFDSLPEARFRARAFAEAHHDWYSNAARLGDLLAHVRARPVTGAHWAAIWAFHRKNETCAYKLARVAPRTWCFLATIRRLLRHMKGTSQEATGTSQATMKDDYLLRL
ncbi:glycosyltransferase family 4 protein [Desulfocurvibacter africanus]|uniref:glycosyltransferase family 4 protein n=1 Tax=Desulfocurvibacter africanus TaxID=873 RepID=UPI000426FDB8|nr:glycosyltransferase family 4 protein [Desulfocurvibacter africanus]